MSEIIITSADIAAWEEKLRKNPNTSPKMLQDFEKHHRQFIKIRHGTDAEFAEAATELRIFGRWIVKGYRNQHNYADIVGTMHLILMEALWRIRKGSIDHYDHPVTVLPYLGICIRQGIKRFVAMDRLLPVRGDRSFHVFSLSGRQRAFGEVEVFEDQVAVNYRDLAQELDFNQLLGILSLRERQIIESAAAGSGDREIGELMEPPLTRQRVHQIRIKACAKLIEQIRLSNLPTETP